MGRKGGNPKITEIGKDTQFTADNQPGNRGRKKLLTTIAKEGGYSAIDIGRILSIVLAMGKDERKDYYDNQDPDGLEAAAIRAVDKAISTGEWNKIKEIIDHVAGRPTQKHELSGEGGGGDITIQIVVDEKSMVELPKSEKEVIEKHGLHD